MTDRIRQCCYSNLASEGGRSGWQVAATKGDIPFEIKNKYSALQDSNVVDTGLPLGRDGQPLRLTEIVAEEGVLYFTRVTYGLKDSHGRMGNMLSHTYLFPVDEELLADANGFLTVSDANFTGDIAVAREPKDSFDRLPSLTLEDALERCGLNRERYQQLIYCVYAQREVKKPLCICSSKGEEILRPLLYCLLSALPLYLRRSFSCASAIVNANNAKNWIVSANRDVAEYYFDLDTGESNLLTPRGIRKYQRWGFAEDILRTKNSRETYAYYCRLEEMAHRLGDESGNKPKVLQIAHQMLSEDSEVMDYEALRQRLYALLTAPIKMNDFMDEYLAKLVRQLNAGEYVLDEMVEEVLLEKLAQEVNSQLSREGDIYLANKLLSQGPQKGADYLMSLSGERFNSFRQLLVESEAGLACLDQYYAQTFPTGLNWQELEDYMNRVAEVCTDAAPATAERAKTHSRDLYLRQLQRGDDPVAAYQAYVKCCYFLDSFGHQEVDYEQKAKELFWAEYTFTGFDRQMARGLKPLYLLGNPRCQLLQDLLRLCEELQPGTFDFGSFQTAYEEFKRRYRDGLSAVEYDSIDTYLAEEMARICPDENMKTKLYLAKNLRAFDFAQVIREQVRQIAGDDLETFTQEYRQRMETIPTGKEDKKLRLTYNNFFLKQLRQGMYECGRSVRDISVDVYLLVGESLFSNPFILLERLDLLDEQVAASITYLMNGSEKNAVEKSRLLHTPEYAAFADDYIRARRENWAVVKAWMGEVKKSGKGQKGDKLSALRSDVKGKLKDFKGKDLKLWKK